MRDTKFILISLFLLISWALHAGNAPVTTCGSVSNAVPGAVSVPVTVTGFTYIGSLSLTLEYDYRVMNFTGYSGHPLLYNLVVGDFNLGNGLHRLTLAWFGNGTTLEDGSTLCTLHFTYLDGNSSLEFYDDGSSCEYSDADYQLLNDSPFGDYYINGKVCGVIASPGFISGPDSICRGIQGAIYSVSPIANASGYEWIFPEGAMIMSGQGTNLVMAEFTEASASGIVEVKGYNECWTGPSAQLGITVNELPVANAGNDQMIPYGTSTTLDAGSGGPGSYSYHWSPEELLIDPDLQDAQTVSLNLTNIFTLTVTDQATGCRNSDEVVVTITGGPLSVNPVAVPAGLCSGNTTQLYANAGGGTGNYTYNWTSLPPGSPPWNSDLANPLVTPHSSTQYLVAITDGFAIANGSTTVSVFPLPAGTISGGDTLCGSGSSAELTIYLDGTPPYSFIFSNGIISEFVEGQENTLYTILTSNIGTYTILSVSDLNCYGNGSGAAVVDLFPLPQTPEITVDGNHLASSSCCGNQWYLNNGQIPGATSQYYTCTESGIYSVVVTLLGCSSEPSEPVDIIVAVPDRKSDVFSISPNPASGKIKITIDEGQNHPVSMVLESSSGSVIGQYYVEHGNVMELDISNIRPGLYFLRFLSGEFVQVFKVFIF